MKIEAGAATFPKIKVHRREADTLAEAGREKEKETARWSEVKKQVRKRVAQLAVKATKEERVRDGGKNSG